MRDQICLHTFPFSHLDPSSKLVSIHQELDLQELEKDQFGHLKRSLIKEMIGQIHSGPYQFSLHPFLYYSLTHLSINYLMMLHEFRVVKVQVFNKE